MTTTILYVSSEARDAVLKSGMERGGRRELRPARRAAGVAGDSCHGERSAPVMSETQTSPSYWSKHWRHSCRRGLWASSSPSAPTSCCTSSVSSHHGASRCWASTGPSCLPPFIAPIYGVAASYVIARLAPDRPMPARIGGRSVGPCGRALWAPS